MPIMDVFDQDAFSYVSLCAAVDLVGYTPGFLTARPGLVTPAPIRTPEVWIEQRSFMPQLIITTSRGSPPVQVSGDRRNARSFNTVRIALSSRINSSELLGIRDFASETAMKDLMGEVSRRQFKMKQDEALTKENMVLGAVQGKVLDADNSVIENWYTNWGVAVPDTVNFASAFSNSTDTGAIRALFNQVRRYTLRSLRGVGGTNVQVECIAGDGFWDAFVTSKEVRGNYQAAQALQRIDTMGNAFESYRFANVTVHNYRGTDDNEVQIGNLAAQFFPVGAGTIVRADAPGESFEDLGTSGQQTYSRIITDEKRNSWADVEDYSYPLFINTMPQACVPATAG
jgi:hypothetical protein